MRSEADPAPPVEHAAVPEWLRFAGAVSWRLAAVGVVAYGTWLALGSVSAILVPLLLGFLLAAVLSPLVLRLTGWGLPRWAAVLTTLGGLLSLLAAAGVAFAVGVRDLGLFQGRLEQGWGELTRLVGGSLPFWGQHDVNGYAESMLNDLGEQIASHATGLVGGMMTAGSAVAGAGFTLVFAFFFLLEGERVAERYVGMLPSEARPAARHIGERAWSKAGSYVRGIAAVAFVNSLLTGLVLALLGAPMVVPMMVVTFLLSFIPFVGALTSGGLATLIALASEGPTAAAVMAASSVAIQTLEGNVLQPMIVGRSVEVHAVLVLVSVGVGGALAGIGGAVLAAPIAAVAASFLREGADGSPEHASAAASEEHAAAVGADGSTHRSVDTASRQEA